MNIRPHAIEIDGGFPSANGAAASPRFIFLVDLIEVDGCRFGLWSGDDYSTAIIEAELASRFRGCGACARQDRGCGMTRTRLPEWPQDKLARFWELQQRALVVDLRLTVDMSGEYHLRDTEGGASVPTDLDAAEASIAATVIPREKHSIVKASPVAPVDWSAGYSSPGDTSRIERSGLRSL